MSSQRSLSQDGSRMQLLRDENIMTCQQGGDVTKRLTDFLLEPGGIPKRI